MGVPDLFRLVLNNERATVLIISYGLYTVMSHHSFPNAFRKDLSDQFPSHSNMKINQPFGVVHVFKLAGAHCSIHRGLVSREVTRIPPPLSR